MNIINFNGWDIRWELLNGIHIANYRDVLECFTKQLGRGAQIVTLHGFDSALDDDEWTMFENEKWLYIPGVMRVATLGGGDLSKNVQRYIFHEVMPSIIITGKYEVDTKPTGSTRLDAVRLLAKQGQVLLEVTEDVEELKQITKPLRGDIEYSTVRARMNFLQIPYDMELGKKIGGRCREISIARCVKPAPKVFDGSFNVNQWKTEIIDEVLEGFRLKPQKQVAKKH